MTLRNRYKCPKCGAIFEIEQRKVSYEFLPLCGNCGTGMEVERRGDPMFVELTKHTEDPEMEIAEVGGISHGAGLEDIEEARDRIRDFVKKGHHSTLEFADATFYVSGVSRVMQNQLVRHRLASFMVKSQRYTDASEEGMVIPDSAKEKIKYDDKVYNAYQRYGEAKDRLINRLRANDIAKEDYRFFLPIGTKTELYIKANFREWRHIIDLRGLNEHAQWEIREFAQRALRQLYEVAPSVFEDQYEEV